MNARPSTRILYPSAAPAEGSRRDKSLRRRLVTLVGIAAVLVLGGATSIGLAILKKAMAGDQDARLANAASLSKQLVDRVLAERARQVDVIASAPQVITAAEKGAAEAQKAGLPSELGTALSKPVLDGIEARFHAARSLQVDPSAQQYLKGLLPKLDIAEVMLTDKWGYNAVTTSLSGDFVQSDEAWWTSTWSSGQSSATAALDAVTKATNVELAGVVRDGATKVGVVKVKFGLSVVDSVLAHGSAGGSALHVELVDSAGRVIAASGSTEHFKPFTAFEQLVGHDTGEVFTYKGAKSAEQRAAVATTNGARWRIVAHMDESEAAGAYDVARAFLIGGVAVILLLILGALVYVSRFIDARITGPAAELARVAEAVAAGDLSKQVSHVAPDDEIGRLSQAVAAMIDELRRLAAALNDTSSETASMTAEITASSEEMAASAGQIAHTAADLSQQSNVMAETIAALADSSEKLVSMAARLDEGAHEGVERNTRLRALALANRARLDESSKSLASLSNDAEASAAAIENLAQASEEIRSFVTLVQKLARQSKLLALNAAMEAARAGEHGHGFAVVAEEVRRLSAMSSDAAERTERVVSGVLQGIAQSRSSSERTVETVRAVRGATEEGSKSFGDIETAVADADAWTSSIEQAVTAATGLSRDMRAKLDSLAAGTESFAAAMQEVAASSEEQSASTEQIAAAAATLSGAADRLSRVVANLRLDANAPLPMATTEMPVPADTGVRIPSNAGISRPSRPLSSRLP